MKIRILTFILSVLLSFQSFSQKKELATITENELRAHLEFIASDLMQGRDFNTPVPGLELTADYLKTQCMKMGLNPGDSGYFQIVEMVSVKPDSENTVFKLNDINGSEKYKTKDIFNLMGKPENDTLKGDIVFCGYGWYNDETKYNDTEGLDIKNKIVLAMTRDLETVLDTSKKSIDTNREMMKINKAFMGGAKALILVPDPLNPDKKWLDMVKGYTSSGSYTLKGAKAGSFMTMRLIFGTEELANEIVKESGKTLLQLQNEINKSGSPKSFYIKNCNAEIQLIKKSNPVEGKNVIAILEGSDPVLKNECVVLSAHYDHIGVAVNGEVNNGADDNGSGTVALLEIAEAFTNMEKHPKRSIVFAWVTAEEKGLFGSDFYSQHPVFPLNQTIANINLDMVGRSASEEHGPVTDVENSLAGPDGIYFMTGDKEGEIRKIGGEVSKKLHLIPSDELSEDFLNLSDYYHFHKNGIPVLGISTGLHEDYHQPSDEVDKIDFHKIKRIADLTFLITLEIANRKKPLK
jgi:hypothetical protein